jgi:hypothetical protein
MYLGLMPIVLARIFTKPEKVGAFAARPYRQDYSTLSPSKTLVAWQLRDNMRLRPSRSVELRSACPPPLFDAQSTTLNLTVDIEALCFAWPGAFRADLRREGATRFRRQARQLRDNLRLAVGGWRNGKLIVAVALC